VLVVVVHVLLVVVEAGYVFLRDVYLVQIWTKDKTQTIRKNFMPDLPPIKKGKI